MGIYLDGKKISGSAQCVYKHRMLYHCTLLYGTDLRILNRVLTPPIRPDTPRQLPGVASVHSVVTNIGNYLPPDVGIDRFITEILSAFCPTGAAKQWERQEAEAISQLKEEKYTPLYH
jgi:lipoate-protein ligase A